MNKSLYQSPRSRVPFISLHIFLLLIHAQHIIMSSTSNKAINGEHSTKNTNRKCSSVPGKQRQFKISFLYTKQSSSFIIPDTETVKSRKNANGPMEAYRLHPVTLSIIFSARVNVNYLRIQIIGLQCSRGTLSYSPRDKSRAYSVIQALTLPTAREESWQCADHNRGSRDSAPRCFHTTDGEDGERRERGASGGR